MADNRRFLVGQDQTQAPDQFKINPRLQRTRAGTPSVRQGLTLGSFIPNFPVIDDSQIRLPNRARPLNPDFQQLVRVPRRDFIGGLDVPNPPALSKFGSGAGIVNKTRLRKNG